jgi:hypothetical protein
MGVIGSDEDGLFFCSAWSDDTNIEEEAKEKSARRTISRDAVLIFIF